MANKIDLDCSCIDLKYGGDCRSPLAKNNNTPCSCSNYKVCTYFPQAELENILESEKVGNLEGSF